MILEDKGGIGGFMALVFGSFRKEGNRWWIRWREWKRERELWVFL